ncbi:MAG: amino acid permease [Hyphomicrobiaceae bacterium]
MNKRSVTLTTATALAVADMIGIGVFTSLGFQVIGLPSGFAVMALWIVGGLVAMCGALSYAELATAFPRSGGEYNYLSQIYNRAVGFLAGWVSSTVGFAAPVAVAAIAFGKYLTGVFPELPNGSVTLAAIAVVLVWSVTLIQLRGIHESATFQNASTLLKIVLIVAFIVAGLVWGKPQPISFAPSMSDIGYIASAPFAIGLVFVMYSYSGWNAMTYIAGELHQPEKVLPRSILLGVLIVTLLYVGLNFIFLYTTPMAAMAGKIDVGLIAGRHIFGDSGGRVVGALICLGLVSAVSAMMWIGPRVTMVIGEDLPLLSMFARRADDGTPRIAIVFQAAMATVLLLSQSFEAVIEFIQFSLTFCSFLAVLGVVILRWTRPDLPRPYRVWAFPLTPLIFLGVTFFMMVYLVQQKPKESLAGIVMMLAGLVVYAVSSRHTPAGSTAGGSQE